MAGTERIRENRELSRYAVFCDGTLSIDGEEKDCKVLNISAGGAQIHVETPLISDGPYTLRIEKCGELEGKIVWQEDKKSGLLFFVDQHQEQKRFVEKVQKYFAKSSDQKRQAPRRSVIFPARAYSGSLIIDCRIKDLSATGAQIIFNEELDISPPFTLKTEKFGAFSCEIAWVEGKRMGVIFLESPAKYAQFVEHDLPKEK